MIDEHDEAMPSVSDAMAEAVSPAPEEQPRGRVSSPREFADERHDQVEDLKAHIADLDKAHNALVDEHAALLTEHGALKMAYEHLTSARMEDAILLAGLETEIEALKGMLPPIKKVYEYAADECRPVSRGGTCEHCGWTYDGKNPNPHAVH